MKPKSKPAKSRMMTKRRHRKVARRAEAAAEKIERLLVTPSPSRYSRVLV